MGIGASLGMFAVGAVLFWALEVDVPLVDEGALGVILMVAGALAAVATLVTQGRPLSRRDGTSAGLWLLGVGAVMLWVVELDLPFVLDDALAVILMIAGVVALTASLVMEVQASRSRRVVERRPYDGF